MSVTKRAIQVQQTYPVCDATYLLPRCLLLPLLSVLVRVVEAAAAVLIDEDDWLASLPTEPRLKLPDFRAS